MRNLSPFRCYCLYCPLRLAVYRRNVLLTSNQYDSCLYYQAHYTIPASAPNLNENNVIGENDFSLRSIQLFLYTMALG